MKLTHLGVSYYRSIGAEPVMIDLSKKITVLVGANNCGKSNVLSALGIICDRSHERKFSIVDQHQRGNASAPSFHYHVESAKGNKSRPLRVLGSFTLVEGSVNRLSDRAWSCPDFDRLTLDLFVELSYETLRQHITASNDRSRMLEEYHRVARHLFGEVRSTIPASFKVPQFRKISDGENYGIDGTGIVKRLAAWDRPVIGNDGDFDKFQRIQALLRRLTEIPDLGLEVSFEQPEIIVRNGTLRLPLSSFGTGIHELIILAIAVLSQSKALVCIEEPEIHLHPLLQRRFLEFLRTETDNRYVITTHSPALIAPNEETDVIHLWLEDGVTKSRRAETTADSLRALHDLGVQASDLLQANSVIWVEGPSDRIYLNHWLKLLAPDLREGIDYAVMFYGGKLLSHLSCERDATEDADDLIQLLRINQHSAILIDSDKRSADAPINATKERIRAECEKSGVLCWITDGKEIENCLPTDAIAASYREMTGCNPAAEFALASHGLIEEALQKWLGTEWKPKWSYDDAKPKMARAIIEHITAENMRESVRQQCDQLIAMIRHRTVTTGASPS